MNGEFQISQSEAGYLLGVSTRTIREWARLPDNPLPHTKGRRGVPATYDPRALLVWWHERELAKLIDGDNGDTPLRLDVERAKLARVQTLRQQLALKREQGDLASIADVGDTWLQIAGAVRSHLLALPAKIAPAVAAESNIQTIRTKIEQEVLETLDELSKYKIAIPDDEDVTESETQLPVNQGGHNGKKVRVR